MPFIIRDRVRETTATTGTGTVTLAGAVSGYQSFAAIGNGNTTYYCIAGQGTNEWEVGIGTYTASGTTLSRTTVLSSSNGGALVPFSAGTKDVFVTQPASRAVFQDDNLNASTGNNFNAASYNGGQLAGFRNKIINGDMAISQRYPGPTLQSAIPAGGIGVALVDRWTKNAISVSGTTTFTQQVDAPTGLNLLQSLRVTTDAAVTNPLPSNAYFVLRQSIEGWNARALALTTFTMSFWVKATKTGVYCINLFNSGGGSDSRAYVAEYTVSASNVWEYKTITVTGGLPTNSGIWNVSNGMGLAVQFVLFAGTDRQISTTGSWLSGPYSTPTGLLPFASPNQVNSLETIGNIFAVTGVQIEPGAVATPFEYRLWATELQLCQRYYENSFGLGQLVVQNSLNFAGTVGATAAVTNQQFAAHVRYAVPKRDTFTPLTYSPNAATANWSTELGVTPTVGIANAGTTGFTLLGSGTATAGQAYYIHWSVSAEV